MSCQGFPQLPIDLLVEIFLSISAFSRISLRQTCKTLYDASKNRTLWIHCLKKMTKECGLFGPSFQYDKMTDEQLEAAANTQLRFRCNLAQGRTSVENVPLLPSLPFDALPTRLSLVPGGRFLVFFHENLLQLWDLGIVGCGSVKPLAMATTACPLNSEKASSVHVDFEPDSNEIFVTVAGFQDLPPPTLTWCTVYKICPLDHCPAFSTVGKLDSNLFKGSGTIFFDPARLIVIFSVDKALWLWYISQNTLVWWTEGAWVCKMWIASNGSLIVIPSPTWYNGTIADGSVLELPKPLDSHSIDSPHCVRIQRPIIHTFSWRRPRVGRDDPTYAFIDRPLATPQMASTSTFDSVAYVNGMRAGEPFNAFAIARYNLVPFDESSGSLSLNNVHESLFNGSMKIPFEHGGRLKDISMHLEEIRLVYSQRSIFQKGGDVTKTKMGITLHISSVSQDPRPNVEQYKPLCSVLGVGQYGRSTFLFSPETGRACIGREGGLCVIDFGQES
ncbi:hypothetical protein DL96DRAFT_840694 [Flagelloscypha sp. PMI_526]|nr:hypothetical protein DL96DRAFT_840694 [Flagelloscypha sp. PMI_526]